MDYPIDESQETELGRITGVRYGRLVDLGIVVTTKRIIRIDYGAETVRGWMGAILGAVLWSLVSFSLLRFLFILLREIVVVIGLGLLPIFIVLIPRYLDKKNKPNISSISREQVAGVMFKKPGIATQRGSLRVNLADGKFFDFWTSGRSKFEEASSAIQGFCNWPPAIPFVEEP